MSKTISIVVGDQSAEIEFPSEAKLSDVIDLMIEKGGQIKKPNNTPVSYGSSENTNNTPAYYGSSENTNNTPAYYGSSENTNNTPAYYGSSADQDLMGLTFMEYFSRYVSNW